jgi:drug/metabolite transporter (DMT)-like permease
MPGYAVAIVLFAALLHALWNALLKNSGDKRLTTVMLTGAGALMAAAILPFLPAPARDSWQFLAGSSCAEIIYFVLLAAAYRIGDMSHAYPIMRGSAPLIVASVSVPLIGEALSAGEWLGIALICGGVLALALQGGGLAHHRSATVLAFANAIAIATYTLIDGLGVRRSHAPMAYTLWMYLITGGLTLAWTLLTRPHELLAYIRGRLSVGVAAAAGMMSSYGLALWAMTVAPVALVAALRETSIVFATVLSAVLLKEKLTLQRLLATSLIVAGAVSLRLA